MILTPLSSQEEGPELLGGLDADNALGFNVRPVKAP